MALSFGGCQSKGTTRVRDLDPGAVETFGALLLGDDSDSAALDGLRDEAIRVEVQASNGDEDDARRDLPRVVRNIKDDRALFAVQLAADGARHVAERHCGPRPGGLKLLSCFFHRGIICTTTARDCVYNSPVLTSNAKGRRRRCHNATRRRLRAFFCSPEG